MNIRALGLTALLLAALPTLAQNFDGFNYQAVVRDVAGDPLPSQAVGVQVIIVSGVLQPHVEVHSVTTDAHGLMKLVIGEGQLQSGPAFSAINWSGNTAWTCCVSVDITGGTNYTSLGCETFKAVPFAMRSLTSDNGPATGWSLNGPTLSNTNTGNVGIGTSSPDTTLHVLGKLKYQDGSQADQKILTSDADGNASWQNLSAASIFGSGNAPTGPCMTGLPNVAAVSNPYDIEVSGNYAYVLGRGNNSILVFDVSTPSAPVLSTTIGMSIAPFSIAVSGNYAYVVGRYGTDMLVFDISTPTAPSLSATIPTGLGLYEITVSGNYAYVVNVNGGVPVFDISTPNAPSLVTTIPENVSHLAISGNYAYLIGSDLRVYDISIPNAPTFSTSVATGNSPSAIGIAGNVAFVAGYSPADPMRIYDISTPSAPGLVASTTLGAGDGASSLDVVGNYVFVTNFNSSTTLVFDMSTPSAPSLLMTIPGVGPVRFATAGNYAYVLNYNSSTMAVYELFCPPANIAVDPSTGEFTSQPANWSTSGNNLSNTNSGNVGIGTNSPAHALDVEGELNSSEGLFLKDLKTITNDGFGRTEFFDANGTEHVEFNGYNTTFGAQPTYFTDQLAIGLDPELTPPAADLDVQGTFKLADGTQGTGKVLTSDAAGNASWQAMPSAGSGTYTPTWVTTSGFTTAPSFLGCTYSRMGAIVNVVCSIGGAGPVYALGTNSATLTVPASLPVANPAGGPQVGGTFASGYHVSGTETSIGLVLPSTTTKVLLKMNGSNYSGIAGTWCSFTYATSAP
ncbi:MAG: hypothetical protein IPI81_09825 [Flavobacteriales bacterium]|nr:hypothetical protein [Flavobacteriales bacterium]